jgi:class 3 adenylate cyclase/predicted ATPase
MRAIQGWLEANGFGQYAEVFAREDLDLDVLPALTEEDFSRLGVSLGHRKRMLVALQGSSDAAPSGSPSIESLTVAGERRQVTVLFCDLVGSTRLSSALDPEAYRALLTRYHKAAVEGIRRFDGYVAQIQGDGVLAYFGYPQAHESEAERAIRAALAVIEALRHANADLAERLQVRIGIASGLVVVSHVLARDKSAVGETPNLAFRLQAIAQPGEVLVSGHTRALAGGAFHYADRGLHQLRGIPGQTRVYAVERVVDGASRFDAAARGRLTPMVGREREVALLLQCWERSRRGEGQVVVLQGEPGIGKSRLLRAFRERTEGDVEAFVTLQCSPFYTGTALYPILDHLERVLGFERGDAPGARLARVEAFVEGELGRVAADSQLLAAALSIACEERYGPLQLSPQRQKEDTLALLIDLLAASAMRRSTVVLFEDVHWADPTTLELLEAIIERVRQVPVLMVITCRPEFQAPWPARPHRVHAGLTRLGRAEGSSVVRQVAGGNLLPDELVERIVDKADGVPLFLEEVTQAVLESGVLADLADGAGRGSAPDDLVVPSTLRDSLMARLDRLVPVKEVAQIGAALGREFSYELVRAVSPLGEAQLLTALDRLTASELVFRRGTGPDAIYVFKHALVQDAAHDSLLKSKRQELHAQIARVIETRFPDLVQTQPELLAHHCTEAGLWERAVRYGMNAGERAVQRTALAEAVAHLTRALRAVAQLPAGEARDWQELHVRMLLGTGLLTYRGHAAAEVEQALEPAERLAVALRADAERVTVLFYLWMHYTARLDLQRGLRIAGQLDALAQSTGDSGAFLVARNVENMTLGWMGDFVRAREAMRRGVRAYDLQRHARMVQRYNHDQKCGILSWAVHFLWMLGHPDQAQAAAQEQVELARTLGHPFNLAFSLTTGSAALLQRGELERARAWVEEARAIGEEHALQYVLRMFVPLWAGQIEVAEGRYEAGCRKLTAAWEYFSAAGGAVLAPLFHLTRARACMDTGRLDTARALLDQAHVCIRDTGHRMHEAEVYRIEAQLELLQPGADRVAAERLLQRSIEIARVQSARGWELRSALMLARLWHAQGRSRAAHELLAPVYAWFTEGLGTRDLRESRALLAELAARRQ